VVNILREKFFADSKALVVISENFNLKTATVKYILRLFAILKNRKFGNIAKP